MKNTRKYVVSLVAILLLSFGGLGLVFALDYTPVLGLDLQGGASVVLQPTEETPEENLEQAIEIIRSRVDGLGVAEPDIARQGDAIVVQLPGVEDPQQALEVVGRTAELRFRPVLEVLPPVGQAPPPTPSTTVPADPGEGSTTTTSAPAVEEAPAEGQGGTPEESSLGAPADGIAAGAARVALAATEETTTTTAAPDQPTTTAPAEPPPTIAPDEVETTDLDDDLADREVVLPGRTDDGSPPPRYRLGPARVFGSAIDTAQARTDQTGATWTVNMTMTDEGIDDFNALATECFNTSEACPPAGLDSTGSQPRGAVAIVLDGVVQTAPTIQEPQFQPDQISISGDFTQDEARDLALVLRFGALPIELEPQTVQTVSATLGTDSLRAGLIAGLVGLGLVAVYMILYYRLLGLLGVLSLSVSAAMLFAIVCYLGETTGLALTLAGITGIIVSVGVAVDSNVVYYERIKDSLMAGTTMRSATDRGFKRSFSTILRANTASLIGAVLLYYFTVGPVRGFAFYLGLSTVLDIVTSYFFMRPGAILLGRSRWATHRSFGVPKPLPPAAALAGGGGR